MIGSYSNALLAQILTFQVLLETRIRIESHGVKELAFVCSMGMHCSVACMYFFANGSVLEAERSLD